VHAGERRDGEKVEGEVILVRNEEKKKECGRKTTLDVSNYECNLVFFRFYHFFQSRNPGIFIT